MRKILIPLFILFGIACFFAGRIMYIRIKNSQDLFTPQKVSITLTPPKNAVEGTITSFSGGVKKEGRSDTDFKDITKPTSFVEGESLATVNGVISLSLPNIATVSMKRNTQIDYLSGLPNQVVVRQPQGTILYDSVKPFSVRSLGLLVQIDAKTSVTITTDAQNQTVEVGIARGEVTLSYSDEQNNTQVKKLSSSQTALFDYSTQTLTLE